MDEKQNVEKPSLLKTDPLIIITMEETIEALVNIMDMQLSHEANSRNVKIEELAGIANTEVEENPQLFRFISIRNELVVRHNAVMDLAQPQEVDGKGSLPGGAPNENVGRNNPRPG